MAPGIPDIFKDISYDQIMSTISPISTSKQHIETESKASKINELSAPQNFSWVNARPDCFVESLRQYMYFQCRINGDPTLCGCAPLMITQAFSDNRCIYSIDVKRKVYTSQYMVLCDTFYSSDANRTSIYLVDHGVPDESCFKYNSTVSKCPTQCDDQSEIRFVKSQAVQQVVDKLETVLKYEITIDIRVYKDFLYYIEGIYKHVVSDKNPLKGQLTVGLVGYGEEKGIKYWIIRSQYGSEWGETGNLNGFHRVGKTGGYMRIARGINECGIDNDAGYLNIP
ncbi:Cathepsine_B [Hexamita inflata]|uniref:Cathepsine B n=1 Tax=Hexamita inflata TaxID=28002 RepID=A0AA86RPF0_9EUKA|nr:Cathepsine B [Hexamita inflata]